MSWGAHCPWPVPAADPCPHADPMLNNPAGPSGAWQAGGLHLALCLGHPCTVWLQLPPSLPMTTEPYWHQGEALSITHFPSLSASGAIGEISSSQPARSRPAAAIYGRIAAAGLRAGSACPCSQGTGSTGATQPWGFQLFLPPHLRFPAQTQVFLLEIRPSCSSCCVLLGTGLRRGGYVSCFTSTPQWGMRN